MLAIVSYLDSFVKNYLCMFERLLSNVMLYDVQHRIPRPPNKIMQRVRIIMHMEITEPYGNNNIGKFGFLFSYSSDISPF